MRATERTYYNVKRLHLWMAVSSLALLAVTVWTLVADHNRQWKQYQRTYQDRIQPWMTEARISREESRESPDREEIGRLRQLLRRERPSLGKRLLRLPLIDALGRPLAIEQVWLPKLTIDYNFGQVARFDRCVTCHQGIDVTMPGDLSHPDFPGGLPHPYSSHPRLDLFVGSSSPHPMSEFGCTICHDGQGSATEFKWASHGPNDPAQRARWRKQHGWFHNPHWDLPMLPRRFAQSRCLKCHHEVTDLEPSRRRPDPPAEKLLAGYHLIRRSGCFGCHKINGFDQSGRSIGPDMRLEPNGAAVERGLPPGTMHKVGPSLRDLAGRLDAMFLDNWIGDPTDFRPSTRMPRLYGLHEHLEGQALKEAGRFEAVEIRAIRQYLLAESRPVEPQAPPPEVTEPPSAERGKRLLEIHGCLACHKHDDFPRGQSVQAPDLSKLGSKYTSQAGKAWLDSWIRDPARHSPRTLMPNALLEPIPPAGENEDVDGAEPKLTDPAADIAAYLLASKGWQPGPPEESDPVDLDKLALEYLGKTSARGRAGAERQLGKMTHAEKLQYAGQRTIGRRGCYGCHDVPGFEDAQPIGPALTDWGRKQESLLAFGRVGEFVGSAVPAGAKRANADPDRDFFIDALLARRREGFIWQKLRAPRSFDYKTTAQKGYDEWLTMGRFKFTQAEREAIITFVLGLVADPPAEQYVYHPDARGKAVAQGRKVLDKYACAQCHVMEMQRWSFDFDPETFEDPPVVAGHEFLDPEISPERIAASLKTDNRGLGTAEVVGVPQVDAEGELLIVDEDEDERGNPIYQYGFTPWEPAAINGSVWNVGVADLPVCGGGISDGRLAAGQVDLSYWGAALTGIRPPQGGALARLLLPTVLAEARAAGGRPLGPEAWGWVPPPLVGEGAKVRPAWLHDYLLAPEPIRPACVLRMPLYNMSPAEAGKLVDYFAAVSGADFPYSSHPRSRAAHVRQQEGRHPGRLDEAMKLLTDSGTDCVKCHLIGDYSPGGTMITTLAPNLERVAERIRPEYLRRWLANPKAVLPYTPMTANFPPEGPPLEPELFQGKTIEQLDAVMDLLLNYDWYLRSHTSIRQLVPSGTGTDQSTPRRED